MQPSTVLQLPCEQFSALLVDRVVRYVESSQSGQCIDIGESRPDDARSNLHLPLARLREGLKHLHREQRYHVVGGDLNARALAAFILTQQGFDAWLVE